MANFPHFVFPPSKETQDFNEATTGKKERPYIQLQTEADIRETYAPTLISSTNSRPPLVRTLSTPPNSPTSNQIRTMDFYNPRTLHESSAITPPATPTKSSHSKSNSASSDFLNTLSNLRRGDSISSSTSERSRKDSITFHYQTQTSSGTEPITFPFQLLDYEIETDAKGRKRAIGSGAWSDVYLAKPVFSKLSGQAESITSPPVTPVNSYTSSQEKRQLPIVPPLYAIKAPASRSARKVLGEEARILSYLSQFPDVEDHIVSFYGRDTRTDALVLKFMTGTLEDWIQKDLNSLPESSRAQKLAAVFPTIASSMFDSLQWMHSKSCIHADIKPTNILMSSSSFTPRLVFSDFSSSILTAFSNELDTVQQGAGTWDYLDPILLNTSNPATPSATTDLWSLAITLLFVIIGSSPFDAFKDNKYRQREMIKQAAPLKCLAYGDQGIRNMTRLKELSRFIGFDVLKWFEKVLIKDVGKRVNLLEWKQELEGAVLKDVMKM